MDGEFRYDEIEQRIDKIMLRNDRADRAERKRLKFFERYGSPDTGAGQFGNRFGSMSVTGRFSINQPNPQPLPQYSVPMPPVPSCPCALCARGEQVETPVHPAVRDYQIHCAIQRENEWAALESKRRTQLLNEEIKLSIARGAMIW
jgi:hypothetical protein